MTTIQWAMLISVVFIVLLVVKLIGFVRWLNKKPEAEESLAEQDLRDKQ